MDDMDLNIEIVRIIENNTYEEIDWDFLLEKYGFEDIADEHPINSDYGENYRWHLLRIVSKGLETNKEQFLLLFQFIVKFYLNIDAETLSEYSWLYEFLNFKSDEIGLFEDLSDINNLKAFISYSHEDREIASEIKEKLESFEIECFMAHDDLGASEEWKQRILEELYQSDIFVALLSDNFKNSEWCSQESGIAALKEVYNNILIIPLMIDRTTPYGFINHRQAERVNRGSISLKTFLDPLRRHFPELDVVSGIINELEKADSFRYAESIMDLLSPHFNDLDDEKIEKVVDFSINNYQIYAARKCRSEYLPNFIQINDDRIEDEKLIELKNKIE